MPKALIWWSDRQYGMEGLTTTITDGLHLTVTKNRDEDLSEGEPAYDVFVFGERLPERCHTMADGQHQATKVGGSRLKDALTVILGNEIAMCQVQIKKIGTIILNGLS